MARQRETNVNRGKGIQSKKGYLYILVSKTVFKNGERVKKRQWISTGLKDTKENVKLAIEERKRLLDGDAKGIVDTNITVSEYIDLFLEKKKREVSETTYAVYFYKTRKIKDFFGKMKLKNISAADVKCFLDAVFEMKQTTRKETTEEEKENNKYLASRTVKDIRVLMHSIFEDAIKDGLIAYNPVTDVKISTILSDKHKGKQKGEDSFFSADEAKYFLQKVLERDTQRDYKLYGMFAIALYCGLRRGEVLGIKWNAINFKTKKLYINHTVTKAFTVVKVDRTKTESSEREYLLTAELNEMFKQIKAEEDKNRILFGTEYKENEYVFKYPDGTLFYPDFLSTEFKKELHAMPELPQKVSFHGLRSSCVSILISAGMDPKQVQNWVGHKDINTTMKIYAKIKNEESQKEMSPAMGKLLGLND